MDRHAAMDAFIRVVETGSFSAAARQLRVGQPAVSKTIAQLEDRLGVRLLLRSSRRLTPTEAGQTFYEHAKRSLEAADEAEAAARGANAELSGRLRFCAPVTFARLQIVPHLSAFLAEHAKLGIEAVLDDRTVDLVEEGIDVALRLGNLTDSALVARKLGTMRRVVVASPAYLARFGEPAAPADLPLHAAIIYTQGGGGANWTFARRGTSVSVALQGRLHFTAAEGVREAVFAGLGLAISSVGMFEPELSRGVVKPLLSEWTLPPIDLWAVFPGGRRVSAKARSFVDFAETQLHANGILQN
ncbi:MAG TPA: LysR family transcriptional regulator [Dongiaceae bacterium]|nr:LysR family transcriptional regulator [Dongiaceae bacterium]